MDIQQSSEYFEEDFKVKIEHSTQEREYFEDGFEMEDDKKKIHYVHEKVSEICKNKGKLS